MQWLTRIENPNRMEAWELRRTGKSVNSNDATQHPQASKTAPVERRTRPVRPPTKSLLCLPDSFSALAFKSLDFCA